MMDDIPSASVESDRIPPKSSLPWGWLTACIIFTIALSILAAHAPARIRLLGLFSIAFGLGIGTIVSLLANVLEAQISMAGRCLLTVSLTILGLIGTTMEIVRLESPKRSLKDGIAEHLMDEMHRNLPPSTATEANPAADSDFHRYLLRRSRQLGHWPSPWPEILWGTELLGGVIAGLWITVRWNQIVRPASAPNPNV